MVELSRTNPVYLQRLQALQQFPLLLVPDEVAPVPDIVPSSEQIVEAEVGQASNAPIAQPEPVNPVVPDLVPVGELPPQALPETIQ